MASAKQQAEVLKESGNAALARKDYPEAIRQYTAAINLDPTNHVYYSNRAAVYTSTNLLEDAISDSKKTIELQPDWPKGYSRLGAAYSRQGDFEKAREAYEEGLRRCPTDAGLKSGIEHLNSMLEQQQQQIFGSLFGPDLLERVQLDPRTSPLCAQPGFLAMVTDLMANPGNMSKHQNSPYFQPLLQVALSKMMGEIPKPSSTPTAAPTSDSSSSTTAEPKTTTTTPSASTSSAPSEPMEVQEEEEEDPEETARKEKKKLAASAKEEGNALYKALKFDEAIAAYDRAIELDPTEMSFYTNRAAVYFQQEKYEDCIKDCEQGILVGREHRASFSLVARALVRIGNAYYKLGNLEAALDAFRRSQTEERSRETAKLINKVEQEKARRDEQAYINPELSLEAKARGNEFFKAGDYPKAIAEYNEAIKRNPTDPLLYTNRALTYQKLWEFAKSIEDCDKALELDPKLVKAYLRKGQTLAIRQEFAKAIEVYRAGLVIEPENTELQSALQRVMLTINQQRATGQVDPERAKRALADPEIQAILKDPEVSIVLQRAQTDPEALQRALGDQKIRHKIETLVAAGIL